MKKRLVALLLVLALLLPVGIASAAAYYRVTTSSLKVRFLPSESAEVLGSYRKDYALTVKSTKNGWSYVTFSNGFQGYVQSKYIKKASSYSAWVTNDDSAMRVKPEGTATTLAKLARGRKVTVLTHGSTYDYIDAGSLGKGYIMNGFLSKKKVAASGNASQNMAVTGGGYYAWVLNAGGRKVNLRSDASTNAPIVNQYPSGTKVYVIAHHAKWDEVSVDGNTGYMMNQFLSTDEPAPTPTPDPSVTTAPPGGGTYTAYVNTANKKALNARKGNSENYSVKFKIPYGAAVTVLKHGTKWDYVQYNGKKGYVNNKFLWTTKPSDAPAVTEAPAPAPAPAVYPRSGKIWAANGKSVNVHKQAGDWSSNVDAIGRLEVGTSVTILSASGGWTKIEYNGHTGYVHSEFVQ